MVEEWRKGDGEEKKCESRGGDSDAFVRGLRINGGADGNEAFPTYLKVRLSSKPGKKGC